MKLCFKCYFIILKQNGDNSVKHAFVPDGHESMLRVIAHSNNSHRSVSHFPYKWIVTSDTSTCINTSSDYFPKRMVTLDIELTITCQLLCWYCCCVHWLDYSDNIFACIACVPYTWLHKLYTVVLYGFKTLHTTVPNNKLCHLLWQIIEQAIVFIVPVMLQWMFTYMV